MFFGKIIKGYRSVLLSILTFLAIALMCMVAAFAISFPLWKAATGFKSLYTVLSLTFFVSGLFYLLVKRILKLYKKNPRRLLISILKNCVLICGLFFSAYLVLSFKNIAAILVLMMVFAVYGFLAFVLPQSKNKIE